MKKTANIQAHRFHDCAALSILRSNGTAYFDSQNARELAKTLLSIAESIESEKFVDSPPLTKTIQAHSDAWQVKSFE